MAPACAIHLAATQMTSQSMMPLCELVSADQKPAEASPFLIEFFMVQGPGYRCVAYCDEDGRWRDACSHEELYGHIRILE